MFQVLKTVARGAKIIVNRSASFVGEHKNLFIGAGIAGGAIVTGNTAFAEGEVTVAFTPLTGVNMLEIISPTVLAAGIATLGATALVASFAVGGGFRIAKKTYSWVFGKM